VTRVAIIGAGPYGLSVAAHLDALDIPFRIFGTPLSTWRHHMPAGMTLKSDPFASNLSHPAGEGTLEQYCALQGITYDAFDPVSLSVFTSYAMDFQRRYVPSLEERQVVSLDRTGEGFRLVLDDGEEVSAEQVVCAVGITHFSRLPAYLQSLPAELVSHSSAHHDLSGFAGREVAVLGAGSSAVDTAALLHEAGAKTTLVARRASLRFANHGVGGRTVYERLRHPSSGLGPGVRSWLCENVPSLFRYVPADYRLEIIRRHLGPFSAGPMKARLEAGVTIRLGEHLDRVKDEHGRLRMYLRHEDGTRDEIVTDHLISATGYVADVRRLTFIANDVRAAIATHSHMPLLSRTFESSIDGLYFVGPPAVNSFGPLMRFMVGSEYAAPTVTRGIARSLRRSAIDRVGAIR
jgi:thioredoxin reductase